MCSWPPALISVGTTALLCGYLHLDHPPKDPSNVPITDPTSGGWNVTQLLRIIDAPIAWDVIERYARPLASATSWSRCDLTAWHGLCCPGGFQDGRGE